MKPSNDATLYQNPEQSGFTLLETLVAFMILAMALAMISQALGGGLRGASISKQYLRATTLAESKLAALNGITDLQEGESSGQFDDTYRWRQTVVAIDLLPTIDALQEPVGSDEKNKGATRDDDRNAKRRRPRRVLVKTFKVDVIVTWGGADRVRSIRLSSMRLMPAKDPLKSTLSNATSPPWHALTQQV